MFTVFAFFGAGFPAQSQCSKCCMLCINVEIRQDCDKKRHQTSPWVDHSNEFIFHCEQKRSPFCYILSETQYFIQSLFGKCHKIRVLRNVVCQTCTRFVPRDFFSSYRPTLSKFLTAHRIIKYYGELTRAFSIIIEKRELTSLVVTLLPRHTMETVIKLHKVNLIRRRCLVDDQFSV